MCPHSIQVNPTLNHSLPIHTIANHLQILAIMEYEPTPSNIPDQRVELSPQRHGHIHLPEAEPVQQGQGHISRSALNGNLRLS